MIYQKWAPKCALPGCEDLVLYHKKKGNSYKWKMFCESHRSNLKSAVDNWKLSRGCENVTAHHGFVCTSTITDAVQLDINHLDGDRYNQDTANLEILCKVCHARVTVDNGHHTNRYVNQVYLNPDLFELS